MIMDKGEQPNGVALKNDDGFYNKSFELSDMKKKEKKEDDHARVKIVR